VVKLVDKDVVDKQTALGAGEVALEAVIGRDIFRVDGGVEIDWGRDFGF
jgi:hypothetical protein